MMTAVEQARNEVQAALTTIAPDILGLTDFLALPQDPATVTALNGLLSDYRRRQSLLQQTHDILVALLADGYPVLEAPVVDPAVVQDLDADIAALESARSRFSPKAPPVAGVVTFGTATP